MQPWRQAWEEALYGPDGFYVRERPRDHFRTSVTTSPLFAPAVRRLASLVDDALGRPDPFDVVDLGGGRGELLLALPDVPSRWRLTVVERAPDPEVGLRWLPALPRLTGLLFAHEFLDVVPLDVLDGDRLVLVDDSGRESLGGRASDQGLAWARQWWPGGGRVEVGLTRDEAWREAVSHLDAGLAVAVDYGHVLPARRGSGSRPRTGFTGDDVPTLNGFGERRSTLTGYRSGRQVPAAPDGTCDLTAHVALDSAAAATGSALYRQADVLRQLGVDPRLPDRDAPDYAAQLQAATQSRTLLDPGGAGGFGWLVRAVGIADPLQP